jgi:hypothetical protein
MDERKKTIRDKEEKKQLAVENSEQLEKSLGKALLERLMNDGTASKVSFIAENLAEHQNFLAEIADAEGQIEQITADVQRLKEVEAAIDQNEALKTEQTKALGERHATLGERVLQEPDLAAYSTPHQAQVDTLMVKVQELSEKLDGLNTAEEKSNLFSRIGSQIGKGVQGIALRSSLTKQQELVQKVYAVAGEGFTLAENPTDNAELAAFAAETEAARTEFAALNAALVDLKAERSTLNDSFTKEGNPGKRVQALEKRIAQAHDQLHTLYCKTGKETADAARDTLSTDLNDADLAMLDQIALCRETRAQTEKEITGLKAAITIDEEKAEIEKYHRGITEQQKRIAASEAEIADFEARITLATAHIEELSSLL